MKTYRIYLRARGYWEAEIEAESRDDALDAAYDEANDYGEPDWEVDFCEEVDE